jgi:hypothetical protein
MAAFVPLAGTAADRILRDLLSPGDPTTFELVSLDGDGDGPVIGWGRQPLLGVIRSDDVVLDTGSISGRRQRRPGRRRRRL